MSKACTRCGELKVDEDFYTYAVSKGRYSGTRKSYRTCKSCIKISRRAFSYNLPFEEVKALFDVGVCAICGTDGGEYEKGLHLDHCHTSGKIRGVLCHGCNIGLGSFKDNVSFMEKAVEYLKK